MPDLNTCVAAMEMLNRVFSPDIIPNDGHEILARLEAGDELSDIVEDLGKKFVSPDTAEDIGQLVRNWPPLHLEAVAASLRWALGKLDTEDRVSVKYKGDAEHDEFVTRFELVDHTLTIEFLHPPVRAQAAPVGA